MGIEYKIVPDFGVELEIALNFLITITACIYVYTRFIR
jgi:hypothetical protein